MPFLGGSLTFERYSVDDFSAHSFDDDDLQLLEQQAAGNFETSSLENARVGFLGGSHLLDVDFDLGKNVINEALHYGIRIDTNKIPAAIRKAWMQMELAAITQENPESRPTKAQRQEAKDAVERRCYDEAQSGKYRRMQSFPLLWDGPAGVLYFGGSGGSAAAQCTDLMARTFDVELRHITAGTLAHTWAYETGNEEVIGELQPSSFVPTLPYSDVAWGNPHSALPDFLGNEFLMWLWYTLENETDTFELDEDGEIVVMMNRTLTLECPRGESGKETITADCPTSLPEAMHGARSGKLPRKTGLIVARDGQQFEFVLQAESLGISGAKIRVDDTDGFQAEDRIDLVRQLSESIDMLFYQFCERRVAESWVGEVDTIGQWLTGATKRRKKKAA